MAKSSLAQTRQLLYQPSLQVAAHSWLALVAPLFALLTVLTGWWFDLPTIPVAQMGELGLLSVLPWSIAVLMALLIYSFALALHQPTTPTPVLVLHVVALIVIVHGTPALIYPALRYSWAWKHLGMVDYIQRFGSVDPTIPVLNVYHNWPGFFAVNALFTEAAGLASALSYAGWAPVFFNLLNLGILLLIYRTTSADRRLRWQAIWCFFLTNWVGQDYFSPQAMNYLLHLLILAICLTWLRATPPGVASLCRWLRLTGLAQFVHRWLVRADQSSPASPELTGHQRRGLVVLVLASFAVIVTSHQLTPLMTILALSGLVIFQQCRVRWLPLVMMGMIGLWFASGARVFVGAELYDLVDSFGMVVKNIDDNLINLAQASPSQQLVAVMGRGLTLAVLGLAFVGGLRRLRAGYVDLAAALLLMAPFLMLAGNAYGGEILFRVYFFALPFLAFFAAAVFYPSEQAGKSGWTLLGNSLLSGVVLVSFSFAYFGKDQMYYFTPNEVAASEFLYNTAPPGSLLVEGSRNYPSQFRHYEYFTYVPLAKERPEAQREIVEQPVEVLARWLGNRRYSAGYVIITRSQKADLALLPYAMPEDGLPTIEQALLASPQFHLLYENQDARIFVLTERTLENSSNEP